MLVTAGDRGDPVGVPSIYLNFCPLCVKSVFVRQCCIRSCMLFSGLHVCIMESMAALVGILLKSDTTRSSLTNMFFPLDIL